MREESERKRDESWNECWKCTDLQVREGNNWKWFAIVCPS